ncbi:MAG: dual specificity protein phosphatase family protein [Lentisphaerae bacterium]|nr:dual specificity protein phosphatase family protein [Lentisphaerota bacterium]
MLGCLAVGSVGLADEPVAESGTDRPVAWAQPIPLAGAPNLHKISGALYRSAQPTAEGMANLKKLGIKTVLNLRSFHSDKDELASTGLASESISMNTWHPEEEDVVRFLKIVCDPAQAPLLVHCRHGADRTGMMCAIYRIVIQGWTREEALREMTEGGFNFHELWVNLVPYIQTLDFDRIRKEAGLDKADGKPGGK